MYKHFFKRFFDLIISILVLPFVLLIVIIMAPIIYFNDKGPVFYNAVRRGKNGKTFKMYKFRSMYVNAPDIRNEDGSTFNSDDDTRVTKVGKFMRKTSLDEIPQLINVLKGDMSLIGPRPMLATQDYNELSDLAKKRLNIKPGITGYAQAYFRNSISETEKFENDCYYIDNLTFILDVKVLFKTIKSVICKENINGSQSIEENK